MANIEPTYPMNNTSGPLCKMRMKLLLFSLSYCKHRYRRHFLSTKKQRKCHEILLNLRFGNLFSF